MKKRAMMFSSGTRPARGTVLTIIPDHRNLGILQVVNVKWWDAHGNWIMEATDSTGNKHTIKNMDFRFWTKENTMGEVPRLGPSTEKNNLIDLKVFEEGVALTSAWLARTLRLSAFDFEKGMKVRWKSAYDPGFWGGYVQQGDVGTVLDVRKIGGRSSVKVVWDRAIRSKAGNDIQQVTNTSALNLEPV